MNEIEAYIRQRAALYGVDPDVAVAAAKTEGGLTDPYQQSKYRKGNFREPSYGPYQMLVGGPGTGFPTGLGNKMIQETGIDPRQNWQAGVDYALKTAGREGWQQWYGPKNAGISRWTGINGAPANLPPQATQMQNVAQNTTQNAVTQGIASLPTVTEQVTDTAAQTAATTAATTPTTPTNPFSGLMSLMASQQTQPPPVPEEEMTRRVDQRPVDQRVAETSQTPDAYISDIRRRYINGMA